jgi:hypothetical protein
MIFIPPVKINSIPIITHTANITNSQQYNTNTKLQIE